MSDYVTEAEVTTYMSTRLDAENYADASSVNRVKAINMATRILERLNYVGDKAVSTQALQFPRGDDTVIPQDLKDAASEIVLALLNGIDPEEEFNALMITSQNYGSVGASYRRNNFPEHLVSGVPSVIAWRFIKPYIRDDQTIKLSRVD